jgi:hypothetical protein
MGRTTVWIVYGWIGRKRGEINGGGERERLIAQPMRADARGQEHAIEPMRLPGTSEPVCVQGLIAQASTIQPKVPR